MAFAALVVLAASLPFELKVPLFVVGPIAVTNVEALLYLTLALWWMSRGRPQEPSPVHWAALFWVLALLASATMAAEFRVAGVKFALRQIGGALLFLAAADLLLAAPRRAVILAGSYVVGAVASAACAVLETAWAPAAEALLRFKTHPSSVEGVLRASGTLQYANLGAMAWGMALPMTTALFAARRGALWRLAAGAGSLVLAEALVRSASRAGLLTAFLVLAAIVATARGRLASLRRAALLTLASVVCLAVVDLATRPGLALRLRDREDRPWFDAEFRVEAAPLLEAGGAVTLPLHARNVGRLRWVASGEHGLSVGYLWLTEPGGSVRVAGPLPRDAEPGESVTMDARVLAPRAAGRHRLRWLLTGDGVAWLSPRAGPATDLDVEVGPNAGVVPSPAEDPAGRFLPQRQPTRPALWRAGLALWAERPVFGVGPDNFRRLYARKLGPHPLDERVHANSLYVEVLATLGLFGATSLAVLAVALARTGARALRSAHPEARVVAVGALSGLAAFFVHGFLDYGLEATALYGAFWLLAGLLAGVSTSSRRHEAPPGWN